MSYPPDPNNPYGQPQQPNYGYPQQQPPAAPGYGYPQQAPPAAPGYGYPQAPQQGYGIPQQGYGYPQPGYQGMPPYASWGSRVVATLIDGLIVGVPSGILYGIGAAQTISGMKCTTDPDTYASHCTGGATSGVGGLLILLGWVLAVAGLLFLLYRVGTTGQTPGKKAMNIRLARESDGQNIGFGMAFVRHLCHFLDGFCCVGYLWPLWDDKRQTFADKVLSTVVVKTQ
ncbi:RDD family protein [Streptomyces sp. TLI_171]|uniref:RDD family protein n=1 Tax=Streptomyces sp. TLI_171 TaxID=1938859 RepID=UPI000C19DD3B|nr:RDD family protein [Streptomyces sp. TLI_171]RKE19467.1 putative RDD family membrane protein YckC [Streptomyces sp. TLI_171]